MQVRFLLGPAGSGKTSRCVADVRAALTAAPDGPPLLFLAPKQATFQLERQLLADETLPAYSRLRILSLERLARFLLDTAQAPIPRLLTEEGRLMVLRALLGRHREALKVFRAAARLAGFAAQLNLVLRELQRHRVTPDRLTRLAAQAADDPVLAGKLEDLALVSTRYRDWLATHGLQDADHLLEVARDALPGRRAPQPHARWFSALWLDGFAEMTPQEVELLAAVVPLCHQATLAFCLDHAPPSAPRWLSGWNTVGDTFCRLRDKLVATPGCQLEFESLPRDQGGGRFRASAALQHLEAHWGTAGLPPPAPRAAEGAVRIVSCATPAQEVAFAARELARFVRESGGRYREAAVLLRSLEGYHALLRREFRRQGIPIFLDRRESVAHHPLVELTRNALRTVAFGWQHDDWFGALKTGLVAPPTQPLDELENEALARGWKGNDWRSELRSPDPPTRGARFERLRVALVAPFLELEALVAGKDVHGHELASSLRRFWSALDIPTRLRQWAEAAPGRCQDGTATVSAQVHAEIWEQMLAWLESVALAFPAESIGLREWLPILEAGLTNLSVGVIPPALDQVLVGAVDRSRNPDLRLVICLGLNEGVFPALPDPSRILSPDDRLALGQMGLELGPDRHRQLGRERYYAYIACTRPRERLVLTFARRDSQERPLRPSSVIAHVQRLFPDLLPEVWSGEVEEFGGWTAPEPETDELAADIATELYGPQVLRTSVSRLEDFAACPFKFFVVSGLAAEERQRFEVDARQRGSFQHEVLRRFHEQVEASRRTWRDLDPDAARQLVGEVACAVTREYQGGLLRADDGGLLSVRAMTRSLQDFVATVVEWMRRSYRFAPGAAELGFGFRDAHLPAWELPLGDGRRVALAGKVDRVDLAPSETADEAWCVIHDYKSSEVRPNRLLLENGIQLQLPAYLAAVCRVAAASGGVRIGSKSEVRGSKFEGTPPQVEAAEAIVERVVQLRPGGFFYANLRGKFEAAKHRGDVLNEPHPDRAAYQHRGHFGFDLLPLLDSRPGGEPSGQFAYRLKRDGQPAASPADPLTSEALAAMLARVETTIRDLGIAIFAGRTRVDPYQKGRAKACDLCRYQAVCRIDPWTHAYRRLA